MTPPIRPSVQPSLYRRGVRFYANIKRADGTWRNYNTGETDRARARDAAEAMQLRADKGLPPVETKDGAAVPAAALLTVRELAARFLREYPQGRAGLKDPDTYRMKARWDMAYLVLPYLGDARAATLRRADVRAYLQRLRDEKNYSAGTLQVALARLSIIYTFAIDEEILDIANPCQGVRLPKAPPSEDHYTIEQIARILALPDVPALVVAALYLGARVGELRALRWTDCDLESRVVTIRASYRSPMPKNRRPRQIPIHRELLPFLKRHKASGQTDPAGLVFPEPKLNGAGQRIGWRMAWPYELGGIEDVMKKAGAPAFGRPYKACRHSLATHLAKATRGNLDVVAKILGNGHGSHVASVTMGYIHTADLDYIAAELDKLSYLPAAKGRGGQGGELRRGAGEAPPTTESRCCADAQ